MSLIKLTIEHEGKNYDLWQGTDEEKRVLDLDLARWAGSKRPHEIRRMAARYDADLRELGEVFVTETKTSGEGGRPGRASYFSEPQALFLLAKMETPRAKAALKALIAVYMMAKAGRAGGEQLRALQEEVQQLRAQVNVLTSHQEQVIGESLARGVLQRIQQIAAFRACTHRNRSLPSLRTTEEQEIRDTIGFARDQPWRLLGVYSYPRLQQELHRRERRARQDAERAGVGAQGSLPGAGQ